MIAVDQSQVEAEVYNFINYISPTNRSNEKRHLVVAFIRDILHKSSLLEGYVIECGSSSLKSYLPESDLDLVLLAPCGKNSREEMQCLTAIFNSWCDEIADKEEGKSTHYDMTIRNVEFVNARTKLAHCLVNNISVDITVNQVGSLLTLTFLEEADRLVGMDHLFKNSLLLIKNWCYHESSYYCGVSIIGAKNGMLSSYAISVMVLHLFNKYVNLTHPFSVLRSFLYTYSSFPWDTHVLTIDGPLPLSSVTGAYYNNSNPSGITNLQREHSDLHSISSLNSTGSTHSHNHSHSRRGSLAQTHSSPGAAIYPPDHSGRFQSILEGLSQHPALALYQQAHSMVHHNRFTAKCCNIQDPVDNCNNLGISVPRHNLMLIGKACQGGFTHLENILRRHPSTLNNNNINHGNHSTQNAMNSFASHNINNHNNNNANINTADGIANGTTQSISDNIHGTNKSTVNVKKMLNPVPPGNLGYIGTIPTPVLPPHTSIQINDNNNNLPAVDGANHHANGSYFHTGDILEVTATAQSIGTTNNTTNVPNVPTMPNRRNSRTTHATTTAYGVNAFKLPFLTEFFPTSLSLYCSPEGEPLRCDLLNHPLQPLSTSSLLANPHYDNNSDPYSHGANRSRGVSSSNVFSDLPDAMSVTSHTSQTSVALFEQGNKAGNNYVADPLLGDLRGMYEALDLYVNSRRVPNVAKNSTNSTKKASNNSAQNSVAGSVQSALSLSPLPLTLPLPMALPISLPISLPSLDISRYISPSSKTRHSSALTQATPSSNPNHPNTNNNNTLSTLATSSGIVKYTPAVSLSPGRHRSPAKLSSANLPVATSSVKKTRVAPGIGLLHSSPTGSTTSGTTSDSPRQRVSISISSDSDSEPDCAEEGGATNKDNSIDSSGISSHSLHRGKLDFESDSGSDSGDSNEEKEEGLEQSNSARRNMRSGSRKHTQDALSTENLPELINTEPNITTSSTTKSSLYGPIGSVLAFFQTQKVYQFCTELPAVVSQRLAALQLSTVNAAIDTTTISNNSNNITVSGSSGNTTNKSSTGNNHISAAQKGAANRKRTVSTGKTTPPPSTTAATLSNTTNNTINTNNINNAVRNKNAALAAAATRRSKRGVTNGLKKLYEVILTYLQVRAQQGVAQCKRLLTTSPLLQRQLIVALVYCIFMIFTINKVLNSSSTYSQYWRQGVSHGAYYLHNIRTFPQWLQHTLSTTYSNTNNNHKYHTGSFDEHEYSQYDFFTPVEAAPSGGFGAAAHSSYAHMFPSSRAKLITDPETSVDRYAVRSGTVQGALNIATHWVKEGDSISFGDFGTYTPKPTTVSSTASEESSGNYNSSSSSGTSGSDSHSTPSCTPAMAPSITPTTTSTTTNSASTTNKSSSSASSNTTTTRSTASTATTATATARAPSEYVQKTQYVPKSEYVLASSSVVGAPYVYQWTKDGVNISNTLYTSQPYFSIKKARMEDAGHYRCMRYDAQVSHRLPVLVMETVLQISKPPTVALRPSHHEVKAGTTMFLNLAAEGTPPPVFQWYRNGYLVPGLTGMALLMEDVNSSHSGTYSCDVQNIAGGFVWLEASVLVVD